MKQQDLMILASPTPSPQVLCLPFVWENVRGRMSLIKEMRKAETKENSQRRPNNNNVVIKHSQGPLVPSQGLNTIF